MARETAGGRIGRTVYLPEELWTYLEALARGEKEHPAFRRWEIRSGSVSSVIERLIRWDAPAKLQELETRATRAEQKLEVVRQAQRMAGTVAQSVRREADQIIHLLTELQKLQV